MTTWFLLFGGTSSDGRGQGEYIGRTTDKVVARNHYLACKKDPYSTGNVRIATDTGYTIASDQTNWLEL